MQPKIFRFPFSLKAVYAAWLWCMLRNVLADARPQNVTIDDRDVAVKYSPFHDWAPSPCGGCQAQPDPSNAFDGTWHDSTSLGPFDLRNITIHFTGTAIYAFCIIANGIANISTTTRLRFTLDGQPSPDLYQHEPDYTSQFIYDVPVYANTALKDGNHELVISLFGLQTTNGLGETEDHSLLLFDYAVYTHDDLLPSYTASTSTTPTSLPVSSSAKPRGKRLGKILGAVFGSLVALALIAIIGLCALRRRKHRACVSPFMHRSTDTSVILSGPLNPPDDSAVQTLPSYTRMRDSHIAIAPDVKAGDLYTKDAQLRQSPQSADVTPNFLRMQGTSPRYAEQLQYVDPTADTSAEGTYQTNQRPLPMPRELRDRLDYLQAELKTLRGYKLAHSSTPPA